MKINKSQIKTGPSGWKKVGDIVIADKVCNMYGGRHAYLTIDDVFNDLPEIVELKDGAIIASWDVLEKRNK